MDHKLLLVKMITLLYREHQVKNRADNSADLIRTILKDIELPKATFINNREIDLLRNLKETCVVMTNNHIDYEYDINLLSQRLKLDCGEYENIYESLQEGIRPELDDKSLVRTINNIRLTLNNYYKEIRIKEILDNAVRVLNTEKKSASDINDYVSKIISQLEPLQLTKIGKDPAVVTDLDIGDDSAMKSIFSDIKDSSDGKSIMKTGWQKINTKLQGGFRRGEFVLIGALQHKYKTGFTLSLFQQIALFNQPYMIDQNKKPLLLRISFEDDLELNMQFMYQYLKYNETKEYVRIKDINTEDMASYVKDKLKVNGYHIKLMRVDPSQWTYKNICNKLVELEAQGYEIHMLMLDYLAMIPTTGCTIGPYGHDLQDMIRRIRNFCSVRKICCITPHQLSTEAKQLLRNGISEDKFVKEVSTRGYFMGSKGLDREIDIELSLHIFKYKKRTLLSLQLGKHRLPSVINDDAKYSLYMFPKNGMPIAHDLMEVDSSYGNIKDIPELNDEDSSFNF